MKQLSEYIGLPFDPIHFNCWHLVRLVQREQFGRDLPNMNISAHEHHIVMREFYNNPERHCWKRVDTPRHGSCVLMRRGRLASHIGVWLNLQDGGILHNLEGMGVVFQRPINLIGMRIEGYYDHDDYHLAC